MNIRQLVSFCRVAEVGSFAAAAKALHATQSTISTRIRELETTWGVELFDRTHHGLQLTAKGQEILPWARQIVSLSERIGFHLGEPDALTGLLRIGVAGRIAHTWLPRLISTIRARYSQVRFDITLGLTAPLLHMVKSGELDIAFAGAPVIDPALNAVSLGYDEFVWMASPELGLPTGRTLTPADLVKWPIVGLSQASPHHPAIAQWFGAANVEYAPHISCNDMGMAAKLIAAGLGIGLLHRTSHRNEVLAGLLTVLDTAPTFPRLEFVAVHQRSNTGALVAAVALLAAEISEFPRPAP
ncbi:LysR family transcriptional regulator [Bordetella genomosp. 10]|uniref:LysR family transcriptional regulator n=1 Tax=Bordetella genomosp. 10 TaxID=1416804 RepID=UPI0015C62F72|nr:LysR family transcriptional regulator [Bordetella genomosp. 10]